MKKRMTLLVLLAVAALPLAASAAEGSIYADILSAYVFNGQVGNDEAVFQPGLDVTGPFGFGFSLWANMDLTDSERSWYPDTAGKWNEIDLGLSWTCPMEGPVSLTLGGTYYVYPQSTSALEENEDGSISAGKAPADGSYEVYVKAAATDMILSPSVKFCHDMDNTDDWIALFSISHSIPLMDAVSLDLGATLGYAGEYYVESNYGSTAGSALTHAQIDAALTYAVLDTLSVGLKGAFSTILDGDMRDEIKASDFFPEVDIFYGGVNVSYSF